VDLWPVNHHTVDLTIATQWTWQSSHRRPANHLTVNLTIITQWTCQSHCGPVSHHTMDLSITTQWTWQSSHSVPVNHTADLSVTIQWTYQSSRSKPVNHHVVDLSIIRLCIWQSHGGPVNHCRNVSSSLFTEVSKRLHHTLSSFLLKTTFTDNNQHTQLAVSKHLNVAMLQQHCTKVLVIKAAITTMTWI